ncbi:hypothetical protein D9M69_501260 [compost metagenome]
MLALIAHWPWNAGEWLLLYDVAQEIDLGDCLPDNAIEVGLRSQVAVGFFICRRQPIEHPLCRLNRLEVILELALSHQHGTRTGEQCIFESILAILAVDIHAIDQYLGGDMCVEERRVVVFAAVALHFEEILCTVATACLLVEQELVDQAGIEMTMDLTFPVRYR